MKGLEVEMELLRQLLWHRGKGRGGLCQLFRRGDSG